MPVKFDSGFDANNQRGRNLASPSAATDAANKAYVDGLVNGLTWKDEVRVATTTAGTLATSFANGQVVDGVTLATGDRILIKDQATGSENGIYVVAASGAPTRSTDADTTAELNNATVKVTLGTVNGANGGATFTQNVANPVVGTSTITFVASSNGSAPVAGNGISVAGSTVSVLPKAGGGILVDGTGVSVDKTNLGLVGKYAATLTAGQSAVTHGLNTTDVHVAVYDITSTPVPVLVDYVATSTTVVTFTFATAPVANQYRVVIFG